MKIKELYIEAKKSRSYQTYTTGITVDVSNETEERIEEIRKELQAKARKAVIEQIKLDGI